MSDATPSPAWAPGYEISGLLRQGSRARIVRATRTTSGADVVLKVLPADAGRAELDQLRELGGVPGVVPLLDAGTTAEGGMFVALPFYADGSFADMLSRVGPAPVPEAAAVARSVAGALGALHARGLTHNDVTPGNVLRAGRTPVLTGFGAVHPAGTALPPPAASAEAFLHAPPEALRGEPRGPASDVYLLASTIWTMLVGHAPFAATDGTPFDSHAYAERVLNDVPRPVPRQDVSRKVRGVLNRALAKLPEDRHPSLVEFTAAFEQARTSRPATTVSGATGGNAPLAGMSGGHESPVGLPVEAPAAPAAPQAPVAPQETPAQPPEPPRAAPSGPQAPQAGPQPPQPRTQTASSPPVPDPGAPPESDADSWFPPEGPAEPHTRLESASQLRPPKRELPSPEERERHGAVPDEAPNSTADIMMARLRGEEVSPLRVWSRLEGWTGDAESSYLPADELPAEEEGDPSWSALDADQQDQPRWRQHLHIAVTVCGILLVTSVVSVFAATGSPEPVVAAADTEEDGAEAAEAEEETAGVTVEPSPLPAVDPASEIALEDTLSAVTLTWADHTGGTGSYFVLGGPQGHDPVTVARTGAGAVTAQVPTDDTNAEYCFTVVAVDGGSAPADEVCTTRAADRAESERLAEEEAAEEEEEEDDEDEDEDEEGAHGIRPDPSPNWAEGGTNP